MKEKVIEAIKRGGVAVIPTDTLYGLVASALNEAAVQKIYEIKKRDRSKPLIVLISSLGDLDVFDIEYDSELLAKYWPDSVSILFPVAKFEYLHRGTNEIAFRLPSDEKLRDLLRQTGPLVAPSANPEGLPPAETIDQAKMYFINEVQYYLDGGTKIGSPSRLIRIKDSKVEVLRS